MNTVGGFSFDSLADFVQRSYEQVETGSLNGTSAATVEQQDQTRDEQRQLVSELDSSIREAQQQKQQPMEKLLRDVRGAVSTRTPEEKGDGKLAEQFQRAGDELVRTQDSFGNAQNAKLPDVFGKALNFIRTAFVDAPQPKQAEGKRTTSSSNVPVVADRANVGDANLALDRRVETRDPRVATFLTQYFGDGFEAKARNVSDKVQTLPVVDREQLNKLPAAEQKFVLSLDSKQQPAYASLPKEEQTFFRGLKPSERGQYLAMSPDERAFFRELKPDERASYIALHPDQREVLRQEGADGRKALVAPEQLKDLKAKEPVEVAKEVSADVLQVFGHEPKEGAAPDTTGKSAQLREKTQQLMMNFLQAEPGNVAHARMQTIKALMDTPEFQNQLMTELEGRLNQQDQARGAQGNQSFAAHFKKIRPLVMQQAQKLIRPDVSRESLLGGLSKAVEISAEFAAAHPPRRRDLRVSGNLQFRYIAG